MQAGFLRAYERIGQFDSRRPFGPWFLRSVANDTRKTVSRRRHVPLDPALAAEMADLAGADPDLDDLLTAADTKEAVWAALDQITPEQRAVVVARYYLDLSDAEIADYLASPPGTVRRRLHDARQRLRHLLPTWLGPSVGGRAQDRRTRGDGAEDEGSTPCGSA